MTRAIENPAARCVDQLSKVIRLLARAREILSGEGRWTRDAFCRDSSGRPAVVEEVSLDGKCSFCATGALRYAAHEIKLDDPYSSRIPIVTARDMLSLCVPAGALTRLSIEEFNDAAGDKHEVLKVFDVALAHAERCRAEWAQTKDEVYEAAD
jgi:hypothetical protein